MKISIVDTFTIRLAEMITGANDAENLIEHARWMGNFLDEQMGANGEKIYKLRDHMRLSMLRRMNRKYTKEQIKNVYENAGLFYQLAGRPLQALEMYEKADSMERMVSILIDNARKSANSAYYYELKKYYLALSEEIVKKSPELMCGMSMLQSLLLNPEESGTLVFGAAGVRRQSSGQYSKGMQRIICCIWRSDCLIEVQQI